MPTELRLQRAAAHQVVNSALGKVPEHRVAPVMISNPRRSDGDRPIDTHRQQHGAHAVQHCEACNLQPVAHAGVNVLHRRLGAAGRQKAKTDAEVHIEVAVQVVGLHGLVARQSRRDTDLLGRVVEIKQRMAGLWLNEMPHPFRCAEEKL